MECVLCSKSLASSAEALEHAMQHSIHRHYDNNKTAKAGFKCDICNAEFRLRANFYAHCTSEHALQQPAAVTNKTISSRATTWNEQVVGLGDSLDQFVTYNTELQTYSCLECGGSWHSSLNPVGVIRHLSQSCGALGRRTLLEWEQIAVLERQSDRLPKKKQRQFKEAVDQPTLEANTHKEYVLASTLFMMEAGMDRNDAEKARAMSKFVNGVYHLVETLGLSAHDVDEVFKPKPVKE